jgi:RNA polymerase sigma-70 factor (ECF subfamily)
MNEENALIERLVLGDLAAEESFFKLFRPRLLRASIYFLGGQDIEAGEIVHDTFIAALPKLRNHTFEGPVYPWLRQICVRLCYARLRNRRWIQMSRKDDLGKFLQRLAMERIKNSNPESQKTESLMDLKKKLNHDSSQIIELRNEQSMSYAQISKALNIPMGTVMSRLARAREQLRKLTQGSSEKSLQSGRGNASS